MSGHPDVAVLIVGAGPVGLAAAIELGLRGIRVLVVERNVRGGTAPRAKTTNVRTRTHLRRWGIADRLAAEAPFGVDYPNDIVFVTRMTGYELARFNNAFNAAPTRSALYPEHAQWIPQYILEKVLQERVQTLPTVELRFSTRFITANQDRQCVTASLQGSGGDVQQVTARYLIGADGSRSTVRELIGATMQGRHGLSRAYNIIFRAPGLAQAHRFGPVVGFFQFGRDGFSGIGPMDRNDTWFFIPAIANDRTLSDAEAAALIRDRTGIDLRYEILSADAWVASELLSDRYADRRIILAGDACHLHPPFGGYGMNMGVGDAVDLGWKIAATLQGWGGPTLVDSYQAERRPVHRTVIDEAVANHSSVVAGIPPGIEDSTPEGDAVRAKLSASLKAIKGREFYTLGTVLGLGYGNSPIIDHEAGAVLPHDSQVYRPNARPGSLAPHAWLEDGRSLYDTFGPGFALIVAEGVDDSEVDKAIEEARERRIPLNIVRPAGVPVGELYEAALTLVRPDQHVAWRGARWNGALGRAVALTPSN